MRRVRYSRVKPISMKVHPDFYNKVESARRGASKNLGGIDISYPKFTEILARQNFNFPTVGRDINEMYKKQKR